MATWSTTNTRNISINEANAANRAYQFLSCLDYYLVDVAAGAATWTRVGSGGGTGSGLYAWGVTKTLPTFPSIAAMATLAWAVWQNAAGAQLCVQVNVAGNCQGVWWSPSGSFVDTGTLEDVSPATAGFAPADMITHLAGAATIVGHSAAYIMSIAYTTDNNSFIVFGRRTADDLAACFITLEDTKLGDTEPYWCWFHGVAADIWTRAELNQSGSNVLLGYHPITGQQRYHVSEAISVGGAATMDTIGADPVSGNIQRVDSVCACAIAGSLHIRGKIPGIWRIPTVLGTGDRIDDAGAGVYDYVVIGDYCVPWGSSDAMLW